MTHHLMLGNVLVKVDILPGFVGDDACFFGKVGADNGNDVLRVRAVDME